LPFFKPSLLEIQTQKFKQRGVSAVPLLAIVAALRNSLNFCGNSKMERSARRGMLTIHIKKATVQCGLLDSNSRMQDAMHYWSPDRIEARRREGLIAERQE